MAAAAFCAIGLGAFSIAVWVYGTDSRSMSLLDLLAMTPYAGAISGVTALIDKSRVRSIVIGTVLVAGFAFMSLWMAQLNASVTHQYLLFIRQGAIFAVALTLGILATGIRALVRRKRERFR